MMNKGKELVAKKRTKCMLNTKSKKKTQYYLGKKESVKEMQENHNSQDIQDQGSEEE
jgi:hypothetical protein